MSELLKLYLQNVRDIPIEQLAKLDNNLLRTYYKYNKKSINPQIFLLDVYTNVFYDILDDENKNKVLHYMDIRDMNFLNLDAKILKDYVISYRELIKKYIIDVPQFNEKYTKYIKPRYAYLDSDLKKISENKLMDYYRKKSQDPKISYFAKELLNTINEMGFDKFIDTIDYKLKSGDISKRIMFLLYIIDDFKVDYRVKMEHYVDVINEKDLTEIIEQNCTDELKRQEFIKGSSFYILEKFPQIYVDMVMKYQNERLELFLPEKFIYSNDLDKKYKKNIYKISLDIWNIMIKDSLDADGTLNKKKLVMYFENYYDYLDKALRNRWEIIRNITATLEEFFKNLK